MAKGPRYGARQRVKGDVLARTKKRAERLGLEVKGSYTGKQARGLRAQVAASRPARRLTDTTESAVNTVASGPGSQRKGRSFQVKYDPNQKRYVHVYGRGGKAKRVYIRKGNPLHKQYESGYRLGDR